MKSFYLSALAVLATSQAQAAVRYDFEALSSFPAGTAPDVITGSISFVAADFIGSATDAPLTNCLANGSATGALTCRQVTFSPGLFGYDAVNFGVGLADGSTAGPLYYFNPGAFAAVGVYNTVLFDADQAGRLTVTNLSTGAVPEPASWAMMMTGFGMVGGALRHRHTRRRVTKVSYA